MSRAEFYVPDLRRNGPQYSYRVEREEHEPHYVASLVETYLLPVTILCSIVCAVVLVIDVSLRCRAIRKSNTQMRRQRSGSVVRDYSIDEFEMILLIQCLDTGAANMLSHLQVESNDISAKIDRCCMALVANYKRRFSTKPMGHSVDFTPSEEATMSQEELTEQWENLRWFHHFVGIHLRNAFLYYQFHSRLEDITSVMTEALARLDTCLLDGRTEYPVHTVNNIGIAINHLGGVISSIDDLIRRSVKIVPLHKRIKYTGKEEAIAIRALCDYEKDECVTHAGEELTLVWRKNKYTWRVKNSKGIEGDLPAVCCLIPGPDPDTMTHAKRLGDTFLQRWNVVKKKCEEKLCFSICISLMATDQQESKFETLSDTTCSRARDVLSFIEEVMKDAQHSLINPLAERKVTQWVLHRLYELLNGNSTREETTAFLKELERCFQLIHMFKKLRDFIVIVDEQCSSLELRISKEKERKKSFSLSRQSSHIDETISHKPIRSSRSSAFSLEVDRNPSPDTQALNDIVEALAMESKKNEAQPKYTHQTDQEPETPLQIDKADSSIFDLRPVYTSFHSTPSPLDSSFDSDVFLSSQSSVDNTCGSNQATETKNEILSPFYPSGEALDKPLHTLVKPKRIISGSPTFRNAIPTQDEDHLNQWVPYDSSPNAPIKTQNRSPYSLAHPFLQSGLEAHCNDPYHNHKNNNGTQISPVGFMPSHGSYPGTPVSPLMGQQRASMAKTGVLLIPKPPDMIQNSDTFSRAINHSIKEAKMKSCVKEVGQTTNPICQKRKLSVPLNQGALALPSTPRIPLRHASVGTTVRPCYSMFAPNSQTLGMETQAPDTRLNISNDAWKSIEVSPKQPITRSESYPLTINNLKKAQAKRPDSLPPRFKKRIMSYEKPAMEEEGHNPSTNINNQRK